MEPAPLDRSVFFTNLSYNTSAGYLRRLFSKVGEVEYVELYNTSRGSSIGAGVVTFATPEAATRAVTELDGADVDGRQMLVKPNERHSRGKGGGAAGGKGDSDARVFWDGVPYSTNEGYLRKFFERHGDIVDFDFWRRRDGSSHGKGTCTYNDVEEADAAIENLNGSTIDGRSILVRKDEKPTENEEDGGRRKGKGKGKGEPSKGGKDPVDGSTVFWSGVPVETTEGYLRSQFEKVGTIVDFDFWRSQDGSSLGKGTCQFDHFRGAERALQRLHNFEIDGGVMLLKEDEGGKGARKGKGKNKGKGKEWRKSE
mmetsp:Transcript_56533/g.106015  ORF Transcript_56533/g.106015 Transcript_56533/m.106015 type:complete len:312 (-) Transcript_56533:123-1058(-)